MKIVPYDKKYLNDFIELNKLWISTMFVLEQEDMREFDAVEQTIAAGGNIFFALNDHDEVLACCMIGPRADGDWEIMKFAARGMYTGTGAGNACLHACMDYARQKGLNRIIVVSNHKCEAAVHLYRKNGFIEIPVDREKFPFDRASIAFEKYLND